MNDRKPSRRERHTAETKNRILQAAKTMFAERGYRQATTREIAEEADVAEGSIFYHFGSKRGLLLALVESITDELLGPMPPALQDDLLTWVREVLRRRFVLMKQCRALLSVLMHEVQLDDELRQFYGKRVLQTTVTKLEAQLNELIAAGRLRPINAAVVARAVLGSYLSFMMPYPDPQLEELSPEEIVASLIDLYRNGLRMLPDEQAENESESVDKA
ncbi:MAG: hypothetical protein DRI52_00920 [Chloroflexi bacterium]|nr:MAG: hypothetical protein DRI52_00920 [Chloroflexota bacterium]